jgi:hypothetical protein
MVSVCVDCVLQWLQEWNQVIAGLGSLVLSSLLVILYYRQQKQLSMEHRGILDVTDVDWDRNEATLKVSNYGNGVVVNLVLITLAYTKSGEHRNHSWMKPLMKRQDKQGEWANAIQSNEENAPFKGKSKVGNLTPTETPDEWFGTPFSSFIFMMKDKGVEEVKFAHVVMGTDLSGNRCLAVVNPLVRSVNPQDFQRQHSLENMPGGGFHSRDNTFERYIDPSFRRKAKRWIYHRGIQAINPVAFRLFKTGVSR